MRHLNKNLHLQIDNFDVLVEELSVREEFTCTANSCGSKADAICWVNIA